MLEPSFFFFASTFTDRFLHDVFLLASFENVFYKETFLCKGKVLCSNQNMQIAYLLWRGV